MLFPDRSDEKKLNALMKKMRIYNPIPSRGNGGYRDAPIQLVIEDANFRDSGHSYFIQSADVVAYLLYQHLTPSTYVRKKSANNFLCDLTPFCARSPRRETHWVLCGSKKKGPLRGPVGTYYPDKPEFRPRANFTSFIHKNRRQVGFFQLACDLLSSPKPHPQTIA